jgi:MFS family permease
VAVRDLRPGFIPVFKTYKGLITAAFALMLFSGFGQSVFFGAYLPEIQNRFSIDKTTLGSIYAAATVCSAFLMVWSGKFLDTMPLRRFVTIVLVGLATGCAIMGLATHPLFLFLAFLALRQFGQGLMTLSGTTTINRYIDEGRGRAQSMAQTGLPVHAALFPIVGIFFLNTFGYQESWLFYSAFILLCLLPFFRILLRAHEEKTHKSWQDKLSRTQAAAVGDFIPNEWTRKQVLTDWRFYAIMSLMVIPPCFGTCIFFYQSVLAAHHGISEAVFASGFIILTLSSVSSALISGILMDKYGEKPLLLSFPLLYASGLITLAVFQNIAAAYAGLFIIGLGGGIMSITGGPLFASMYGTKNYGSIKSLSMITMVLASSVSPPLAGYLLDSGMGIGTIFIFFAAYSIFAWLILCLGIGKIIKREKTHDASNA